MFRLRRILLAGCALALAVPATALAAPIDISSATISNSVGHWPSATAHRSSARESLRFKGAPYAPSSGNLIDHGEQIMPASHTYAIFWGSPSAWPPDVYDVSAGIASLFSRFDGSSYLRTAQQCMRGKAISTAFMGEKSDPSAPPAKVSNGTLAA
jgi:hypothetical protein